MGNISENIHNNLSNFHMAGIIPVFGSDIEDDELPWHKSLTQLAENLLAVERAVLECNFAGCETIWIICNEDMQPLIHHRVGDYAVCLQSMASSRYTKFSQNIVQRIPIFYAPLPALSRGKRDSLAWAILHGANEAFMVSAKISKWITPNKYYVAFPYGVYDPRVASRGKKIYFSQKNVMISFAGKSVTDGLYTGFTFKPEEYKKIKRSIKNKCSGLSLRETSSEKWSSRYFTLDKFYNYDNIENVEFLEVEKFQTCDTWPKYLEYLKSDLVDSLASYNLQKINGKLRKKVEKDVV